MNLTSGAALVAPDNGLEELLAKKGDQPLRVKFGIDPTGSDLTLGHAVVLRKLRQFQDAGHTAVLIVGDFTAQVGDPTGRSNTRAVMSPEETAANAKSYLSQALKVLSTERLEVLHNSDWLSKMTLTDILSQAAHVTVAQLSTRKDFANRLKEKRAIALSEFFYPLLQAIDSVQVRADVELGGSDQMFNLMLGRELQKANGQDQQVIITMPILEGLDGVQKMSKSLGNFVALTEPAEMQFGKLMSIPDTLIERYALLASPMNPAELENVGVLLRNGGASANQAKRLVAKSIVSIFHPGEEEGAEAAFNSLFVKREAPTDSPDFSFTGTSLPGILADAGLVPSKAAGKRLIEGGGVRLDGVKVSGFDFDDSELRGKILQAGKRKSVKLV